MTDLKVVNINEGNRDADAVLQEFIGKCDEVLVIGIQDRGRDGGVGMMIRPSSGIDSNMSMNWYLDQAKGIVLGD